MGSIPESGRSSGEGNGNALWYSCWRIPWKRSLVGYSPWGRKEDMTGQLSAHNLSQLKQSPHITEFVRIHKITSCNGFL